jgi:hypothetical protein
MPMTDPELGLIASSAILSNSSPRSTRAEQPGQPTSGAVCSNNCAELRAYARGDGHRQCAPEGDTRCAGHDTCAAGACRHHAEQGQEQQRHQRDPGREVAPWGQPGHRQWQGGADGNTRRGSQRRLHRPRGERRGDAELVARMRTDRIVRHQLFGHLLRQRGR